MKGKYCKLHFSKINSSSDKTICLFQTVFNGKIRRKIASYSHFLKFHVNMS